MTINEHLTTFFGRPVVTVEPGKPLPTVDGPVAWRIESEDEDWDERAPLLFEAELHRFLDLVDPATVEALVVGAWGYAVNKDAPVPQLCAVADRLPNLRALFFGDITYEECEISWINQGDITMLLEEYPRLEVLRSRGMENLSLRPVRHEHLRELGIETGGLPREIVHAVNASTLPALTHLELWIGMEYYQRTTEVADLAPILAGDRFPHLRYLGLRNAENADEIAAALAVAPVVPQLETLDLSLGCLGDTGAEALLAGQSLMHLTKLDLHHHYLSTDMTDRLRAALPEVDLDLSEPKRDPSARWTDDDSRWTAVSE